MLSKEIMNYTHKMASFSREPLEGDWTGENTPVCGFKDPDKAPIKINARWTNITCPGCLKLKRKKTGQ